MADMVDKIMAYEQGEMSAVETVDFFAELIQLGVCWGLQGHYGRTATRLIDAGYVSRDGKVVKYPGGLENV